MKEKYKVLIADDEKRVVKLIKNLVDWEKLGLEYAGEAYDGQEALKKVKELHPDILITDIKMPGVDGLVLARKVQEIQEKISVIIISGYKVFDYAYDALKSGVIDFLIKPINASDLNNSLARLLKIKESQRIERSDIGKKQQKLEEEFTKLARNQFLFNCLHQIGDCERDLEQFNRQNGFRFREGLYGAFLIRIFCPDHAGRRLLEAQESPSVSYKVYNIAERLLSDLCYDWAMIEEKNVIECIYNIPAGKKEDMKKAFLKLHSDWASALLVYPEMESILGVGRFYESHMGIGESVRDAFACTRMKPVFGTSKPVSAERIQLKEAAPMLTKLWIHNFDVMIHDYQIGPMEEFLDQSFTEWAPQLYQCPWQLEILLTELLNQFREEVKKDGIKILPEEITAQKEYFLALNSLDKLKQAVREYIIQIMSGYIENMNSRHKQPITIAIEYIEKHYAEPVSLEDICAQVDLSYHYFSGLFKQETGVNITDYLIQVRIDHAKRLLKDTTKNISEIAELCGYSDARHFSRLFAKRVGIKPQEYRRMNA
ncbi:response regulator [Lachnospiraceae bacterium ASD3451]|uniref:response regulator n=1 Tax=Diplocloster agilis TaxID=2850323 RepID=UPI001D88BF84|nr:response regulator [Diplocloster agilis]MBU9743288.1 response regulator [Diplocloster agilis]